MEITNEDLANYDHRFSGVLIDALIRKGIFNHAEIAAMHKSVRDGADPDDQITRELANRFIEANEG